MKPLLIMLVTVLLAIQVKAQKVDETHISKFAVGLWDSEKGDWAWEAWKDCDITIVLKKNNELTVQGLTFTFTGAPYEVRTGTGTSLKAKILTQMKDEAGKSCVYKIVMSVGNEDHYIVYDDFCIVYKAR